jgi:hypothetical protein
MSFAGSVGSGVSGGNGGEGDIVINLTIPGTDIVNEAFRIVVLQVLNQQ